MGIREDPDAHVTTGERWAGGGKKGLVSRGRHGGSPCTGHPRPCVYRDSRGPGPEYPCRSTGFCGILFSAWKARIGRANHPEPFRTIPGHGRQYQGRRTVKIINHHRIQDWIAQWGQNTQVSRLAAVNNIEIIILVVIWFALNLSMIRDWIAERKGNTPRVSR
jgi:hypothetical protein